MTKMTLSRFFSKKHVSSEDEMFPKVDSFARILQTHCDNYEAFLKKRKEEFTLKLPTDEKVECSLEDFSIMKTLGRGTFGKVVMCQHKNTATIYAMKIIEKRNVIKSHQLANVKSEVSLLNSLNFQFIINLEYFFKNNVYLFIVMPAINGGDMFYHLRKAKRFQEDMCKFYAAQIVLSLEYMHYLGVVYRDLKPENLLLDTDGYVKIIDVGFSKKIDMKRTYTLCGTPDYLAPEILLSQSYGFSVDWWSFGILVYELAAGFPPFADNEYLKTFQRIIGGFYSTPKHFSEPLKNFLQRLIQVDRTKRYGSLKNGVKDIKTHQWFRDVEFDKILGREYKPSFVPKVLGDTDSRYFIGAKEFTFRVSESDEFADQFESVFICNFDEISPP